MVKSMFNLKRPSRIIIVVALVAMLGVKFEANRTDGGITSEATSDSYEISAFSTLRTPYVGDNSKVGKIIAALPSLDGGHTQRFFSIGDDYGTGRAPFTLTIYYEPNGAESDVRNITVTPKISALLFALIDNLEEVNYAFRTTPGDSVLDKSSYVSRVAYSKEDITEYLETVGLNWEDFRNDLE